MKYFLLFFPLSLPIRSLEAEDFRLVVSWRGHCDGRFPERGWHRERNWRNVFYKESSSFAANWYLLMVKSRISAVWPWYSDTMLPERPSHNRSAPSKQQVDTTEEDSSHCRWTMPACGNTERYLQKNSLIWCSLSGVSVLCMLRYYLHHDCKASIQYAESRESMLR